MKNFSGAVVITGASSGIGEECALYMSKLGFHVFAGVRKENDGQKLRLKAVNHLEPILMDVTDEQSIAGAFAQVADVVGNSGIVGLVNNAGVAFGVPLELIPIDDLRQQLEVNVIGTIAVIQKFLPLLRSGKGRIVNIGSISGLMAEPFFGLYSASKHALEAFTDSLREELRPWNISVSIIEPGCVLTPIWEKSLGKTRDYLTNLSPEEHLLYGDAFRAFFENAEKVSQKGISPEVVARAVVNALTDERPKTRCILGRDAKIKAVLIKPLPERIRDFLITRIMGLPKKS